jgi:hypothetical protein
MDLVSLKTKARAVRRFFYRRAYRGYGPMPYFAKYNALQRVFIPGAPLIETGTYLGDSSRFFASRGYPVHTVEVSADLGRIVFPGLRAAGIKCYEGDSGVLLGGILDDLQHNGTSAVNFWLDGHWSKGPTSKAGAYETPIVPELETISARRNNFLKLVVAIDDVRCFGNDPGYPDKKFLVDWAVANRLGFYFLADIFVASTETYADI